jgi:6,7-dimethyl-8-ribityllumazine synthase
VSKEQIDTAWVPGGFEIPIAAKRFVQTGRYAAVICVGCIIQGDTPHFHYVASEETKGIAMVSLDSNIPVVYGIVTAETLDQAIERSGTKAGNRGASAAVTAIEMANLIKKLPEAQ